jgi:hypothetical protein
MAKWILLSTVLASTWIPMVCAKKSHSFQKMLALLVGYQIVYVFLLWYVYPRVSM